MLVLLASASLAAAPVDPNAPTGPVVPLAYVPGTAAGNAARFYVLSLHLRYAPSPEDARPLEVVTCPGRLAMVPIPTALAALKRGFALAGLEVKVDGEQAGLAPIGPAPAKAPFALVLPQAPPAEVVTRLGATSEAVDQGFLVVSTVDRRAELEGALCPDAGAAPKP